MEVGGQPSGFWNIGEKTPFPTFPFQEKRKNPLSQRIWRLCSPSGVVKGDSEESDISNDETSHWAEAKDGQYGFF